LSLRQAAAGQFIPPEIIGFVLGSLVAALAFREFRPRKGSSPIIRFLLGMFSMIGALVFLGCPWQVYFRLSGGDWNAILGILGYFAGIALGVVFMRKGFSLGRSYLAHRALGWIMPVLALVLLTLLIAAPQFGRDPEGRSVGSIFFSVKGPWNQPALLWISLGGGLLIGFLAQRSRFCTVGAVRDLILMRNMHLFNGIIALMLAAFITNLILGQFKAGFASQPIVHSDGLWNFAGMVLAGLAFTLAGGCPSRQIFLSGEGDGDAAIFVFGMIVGAGFAHYFKLSSSSAGPAPYGPAATIIGLIVCALFGLVMKERVVSGRTQVK
jgi:YedE family putative selenium metabolism protein